MYKQFGGETLDKIFKFPLKMHVGAPCEPIVNKGDRVERGQCIACLLYTSRCV